MKRNRTNSLTKLQGELNSAEKGKRQKDERFWTPTIAPDGTSSALIRFLPTAANDTLNVPWAKFRGYAFKGPTGLWYIENSPTTIGQKDPVSEYNSELWKTENPSLQEEVRKRKQKVSIVANIIVLKDPEKPENEGKVFLYKFGVKIFDKIKEIMNPDDKLGEEPVNPFDFWQGADFKLKVRKVSGFTNYDKSEFAKPNELLAGDEEKLKVVYEQLHRLDEFLDVKNFKSYEELKTRMNKVLGLDGGTSSRKTASPKETVAIAKTTAATVEDADTDDVADNLPEGLSAEEETYLQGLASDSD